MTYEELMSLPDGSIVSYSYSSRFNNDTHTIISSLITDVDICTEVSLQDEECDVHFYFDFYPENDSTSVMFSQMSNIQVLPNYYKQFHPELFI
jgi:hypothetical protein